MEMYCPPYCIVLYEYVKISGRQPDCQYKVHYLVFTVYIQYIMIFHFYTPGGLE